MSESDRIRVGYVLESHSSDDGMLAEQFLGRLERETGARLEIASGAAEALLTRLSNDELDLVIGEFATKSPWATDVAILEPLHTRKLNGEELGFGPVAKNGENAWIIRIERNVRALKARR
ncbi:MAG: hypothetical protein EON58_06285 [Alphaproteobacteria bacterium]|nr:MAG: hypothetical protein EON58_06285 [Alphaproteobacteria bacterium]